MIKTKKILSILVVTILLGTSFLPSHTSASTIDYNMVTKIGEDLKINYIDENSWEYFQEKDGTIYKIEETANLETGVVKSAIKSIDKNGNLSLQKTTLTTPKENGVEIKTTENGSTTTEMIEISSQVEANISSTSIADNIKASSDELTPWRFSYTNYNSSSLDASLTYGAIAAVISSLFNLGLTASIVVSSAAALAADHKPNVYTRHTRSHKNVVGTTILAGIMDDRWTYENSNHTGIIAYDNEIDCASGYSCN
ncbi:hypothetical protein [Virgibacillus salexigens]|uniref:hypothetical protein n=1 Tax=Virgibacillus salexigens TaxID=61016 RepID=UPI00308182DE